MSQFFKSKTPQLDCESEKVQSPLLADDSEESHDCKYDGGDEVE